MQAIVEFILGFFAVLAGMAIAALVAHTVLLIIRVMAG